MRVKLETITHMSAIIEASVKPIQSIKGVSSGEIQTGNFSDQLINGLLKYRAQAPVIDSILKDIGLSGESIQGLTKTLANVQPEIKVTEIEEPNVSKKF